MSNHFKVALQSIQGKNPPAWAIGEIKSHSWYYENEHGEQWVAVRDQDTLLIAGLDLEWEEIVLTLDQAEAEYARISELRLIQTLQNHPDIGSAYLQVAASRQASSLSMPLSQWFLGEGESLWISAVLSAAIPVMKWQRNKKNNQ